MSKVSAALRKADPSISHLSDDEVMAVVKGVVGLTTLALLPEMFAARVMGGPVGEFGKAVASTLLDLTRV